MSIDMFMYLYVQHDFGIRKRVYLKDKLNAAHSIDKIFQF